MKKKNIHKKVSCHQNGRYVIRVSQDEDHVEG